MTRSGPGQVTEAARRAADAVDRATSARRLRRLRGAHSIGDIRGLARASLPRMVFDFVDGGAEGEVTLRDNRVAFDRWWLQPRVLVDVEERDTGTELLGRRRTVPLVLSPAGLVGLVWPDGEAAAAEAAGNAGVPFAVSAMSSVSVEDVRASTDGSLWLQVYIWRDRDATEALVRRSAALGYETLCLTVDVPVTGRRDRDLRNGMTIPPRITLKNSLGVARHPGWAMRVGAAGVTFANLEAGATSRDTMRLGAYINEQFDPAVTWDDLRWLRRIWDGKLVVKGVLDPEAARRLIDEGVDGIVVSNHGGRQLDGIVPSVEALPSVVAAVDGRVDVILDSGIRRGSDVIKAVALGATSVMFGRPYVFGLAAGGAPGVARVLDIFTSEIDRVLALLGVASIDEVRGHAADLLIDRRPLTSLRRPA